MIGRSKCRATIIIFLLPVLAVAVFSAAAYGGEAASAQWVGLYPGPGNVSDFASSIAVSRAGDVLATGLAGTLGNPDFLTIKYNKSGRRVWARTYNGPGKGTDRPSAVAVDSAGNVYVTGASVGRSGTLDYATIKYNAAGARRWVRRYNGPGGGTDRPSAITVDDEGGVYLTGSSSIMGSSFDALTIKYDAAGNRKWMKRFNGAGNSYDSAVAIARDSQTNIYIAGSSGGGYATNGDFLTIKYDSAGNQRWVRNYNGPRSAADEASDIAVDSSGNILITGTSMGEGVLNYDYVTIKYDSSGNVYWVRRYDDAKHGIDWANAVAVAADGSAYVTGSSQGDSIFNDILTLKYDANGNQQWGSRYAGSALGDNSGNDIAVGKYGNIYVVGSSRRIVNAGDFTTIKYGPGGARKSTRFYNGGDAVDDRAGKVAIGRGGNVFVTGFSTTGVDQGAYVAVKYGP